MNKNEYQREYYKRNREAILAREKVRRAQKSEHIARAKRSGYIARMYGISQAEFDAMRERQDYRCACCERHESDTPQGVLDIDHCHQSGLIRGLLCRRCNVAIGQLGDTIEAVERALAYLRRSLA